MRSRPARLSGFNDFVILYAGSHLVGSPALYDPGRIRQVEIETSRATGASLQFTRPPYYAALLWPLGQLPHRVAYAAWQGLSLAAVIAFIFLGPEPARRCTVVLACCWSIPLSASLANGQDTAFLLLRIVLALRFYACRPFLAGLALALCAAKFHLFLPMPLFIAFQRRWRMV